MVVLYFFWPGWQGAAAAPPAAIAVDLPDRQPRVDLPDRQPRIDLVIR